MVSGGIYILFPPDDYYCNETDFNCTHGIPCIPSSWVCDGQKECEDGSDELDQICGVYKVKKTQNSTYDRKLSLSGQWSCGRAEFQCLTGKPTCIHSSRVCNAIMNCADGSDEISCGEYLD